MNISMSSIKIKIVFKEYFYVSNYNSENKVPLKKSSVQSKDLNFKKSFDEHNKLVSFQMCRIEYLF